MQLKVGVGVWSSTNWEDEIIAAIIGVSERPVFIVARVPGTLEGHDQDAIVVRHRRTHHALCGVSGWLHVPSCSKAEHNTTLD